MNWDYDVIVVGAGPGGATASRCCAQAGLKTLLIEKERLPRYKVCGGCLSAKLSTSVSTWTPSLRTPSGSEVHLQHEGSLLVPSDKSIGFMVMRSRFDQLLAQKAFEQGAEFLEREKVVTAREVEGGIEVSLEQGRKLCCEYLIGADGAGSVVARTFSLLSSKTDENGFGLQSEVPYSLDPEFPKDDLPSFISIWPNPLRIRMGFPKSRRAFDRNWGIVERWEEG
jgi:flavin-dependent dehydrogenase